MPTVIIPAFALFAYSLIFVALTAVKKNKTVLLFMMMLVSFILFSGGSLLMRLMLWPGVDFWCKVSIGGMFLIPYLYYCLICEFVGYQGFFQRRVFLLMTLVILMLNFSNALFTEATVVSTSAGQAEFIFEAKWPILIPVVLVFWVVIALFRIIFRSIQNKERALNDYAPLLIGISVLALGTTLATIPAIGKYPLDTLAGLVNACCLVTMLYRQRLFKLTPVVSRGTAYALTAAVILVFLVNFIQPIERTILLRFPQFSEYSTSLIVLLFTLLIIGIYHTSKQFLDVMFSRDENRQTRLLKEYSEAINRTIQLEELSGLLIQVIRENVAVEKIYLCLKKEEEHAYRALYGANMLDSKQLMFAFDSPCVKWLSMKQQSATMNDFRHSVWYKSLWETEKEQFDQYQIGCFVPLFSDTELVGILALSEKNGHARYTQDNLMFLDFIASISGIAIKNAHLYEMIYHKASHDNLTGLLNREFFFGKIEKAFQDHIQSSIALILFNLDDFSLYNELYGRSEGDRALQGVAEILSATGGRAGISARYGNKEFALLLPDTDGQAARKIAEMVKNQIGRGFDETEDQWEKNLTVSVGICVYPYAAGNLQELISHTEMAVFYAKQNGKNQIISYTMEEKPILKKENPGKNNPRVYAQYASTIYALTAAIDVKDHYTFNHSNNVANYAARLAAAVGLNEEHIELIREAALLHDIGKIGIPEDILNKTSTLTEEEYAVIQQHVENSISIIRHLPSLTYVIPAVLGHHERWDGQGYPRRLKQEENPIAGRCLAIADAYDAMTTKRSYRNPMSKEKALAEIERCAGTQFDPTLAALFVQIMKEDGETGELKK